ncbi:MAG: hypothetical protein MJ113_08195, partial [Lachnospiraceae bacterium]|nr:hypothetical protein [Lachnospiraceae bacterium]
MRGNFSERTENFFKIVLRLTGVVAIAVIAYLVYVVAIYENKTNIGVSEVKVETFAGKEKIKAICIRKEQILKLSDDGYVHVYKKPYERVSAQSVLFSVFDDFSLYNEMSSSHTYTVSF